MMIYAKMVASRSILCCKLRLRGPRQPAPLSQKNPSNLFRVYVCICQFFVKSPVRSLLFTEVYVKQKLFCPTSVVNAITTEEFNLALPLGSSTPSPMVRAFSVVISEYAILSA